MILGTIPPLWFSVIDPRIKKIRAEQENVAA